MADQFRVGEFAELCNLVGDCARFNGHEVLIVDGAKERTWMTGDLQVVSGLAYLISYDAYPLVACRPENLRKRHPPMDTVDSAEPNKKTNWVDGPWRPKETSRV